MHANMDYNGQRTNLSMITSDANINSSCQNKNSLSKVENVSSASDSDKVPKQIFTKIPLLYENEHETYFNARGRK